MRAPALKRDDLVYPEFSYQIVGALLDVYSAIGHGYNEKVYQKAVAVSFDKRQWNYKEQVYVPVIFEGKKLE